MGTTSRTERFITLVLQIVGGLILLAIALPVLYLTYWNYAPHLLLNETTRGLYSYREVTRQDGDVDLIPGFFRGGEAKSEVETRLLAAGLDAWNIAYEIVPPGVTSIQKFRLGAGARGIACGNELFLTIGYDDADLLTSATIAQGGACL